MDMIQIHDVTESVSLKGFQEVLLNLYSRLKLEGRVTIRLGDESEGRRLNSQYRNLDYATDVLSFPMSESLPDGLYLGDMFICLPVARLQAESAGHSLKAELLTLMIHGLLHLAGYDHETDDGEMTRLQENLEKEIEMDIPSGD